MSRAYEALLADRLVRLDRWIAESESRASRSGDAETLQDLEVDLARWRDERNQCERRLGRTKSLNQFARWALATLWISFAVLLAIAFVGADFARVESPLLSLLVAVDVLLLIGFGATYVIAIVVRDVVAQGRQPWRFDLRSLLMITTVIAVQLALLTYMFRN